MTAPRSKIDIALAESGWPSPWATEQEAARLSGLSVSAFRAKVKQLELQGFPKKHPINGKRSKAAILAFFGLPTNHSANSSAAPADSEPDREPNTAELETFDDGHGQRKAS